MKPLTNLAIGLTTVATFGSVTAAMAAQDTTTQPLTADPEKAAQMQEIRDAIQSGDMEKAKELKDQYGLKGPKFGRGPWRGGPADKMGKMDPEKKQAVQAALDANDYQAFLQAFGDKAPQGMTKEKFTRIVALHNARKAGDTAKIQQLRKEMGLKIGKHLGRRFAQHRAQMMKNNGTTSDNTGQ